jgi:hypothetical protein
MISSSHVQLCDLSYLGKICRSTHQLGEDANYNELDDMIHAGSVHIFTIFCKIQLSTLNGPSTELQIDDILRYLGENDNQESALSHRHLMYQLPHLSHRLHRPVPLHSTRGWQPPLKDCLDLLSYTTTITPTRRGLLGTAVTPGEFVCALTTDFRNPMMFNHNIAGAAKQLSTTLVKVSTELLTSTRG